MWKYYPRITLFLGSIWLYPNKNPQLRGHIRYINSFIYLFPRHIPSASKAHSHINCTAMGKSGNITSNMKFISIKIMKFMLVSPCDKNHTLLTCRTMCQILLI